MFAAYATALCQSFMRVYVLPSAFPLDLFGFERYTLPTGSGWSNGSFSTRLRVLKLAV